MPVYSYKAVDTNAGPTRGSIIADSLHDARDRLRSQGLIVRQIKSSNHNTTYSNRTSFNLFNFSEWLKWGWKPRLTQIFSEIATLIQAGIPLLDALDTVIAQEHGQFQTRLRQLRDDVASGLSLSQAMANQSDLFDSLSINIIEVGQRSGTLDIAMQRITQFRKQSEQFKGQIATAMMYPCFVLLAGVGVGVFLMTFVVPNLLEALTESGKPLPIATQIVKSVSDLLVHDGWIMLTIIIGLVLALSITLRTEKGRRRWHLLQLSIPVLGELIRKQVVMRIAIIISTLLKSGIELPKALEIAKQATHQQIMRQALQECEVAIEAGSDVASALSNVKVFPLTVVQLFAVGQESGQLETLLDQLAENYRLQSDTITQRLTTILEPVLIVILAGLIGLIAFATILPILESGYVL